MIISIGSVFRIYPQRLKKSLTSSRCQAGNPQSLGTVKTLPQCKSWNLFFKTRSSSAQALNPVQCPAITAAMSISCRVRAVRDIFIGCGDQVKSAHDRLYLFNTGNIPGMVDDVDDRHDCIPTRTTRPASFVDNNR